MPDTSDITTTIIELLKRLMVLAEVRAKTLPYRINLIQILGDACETENSKILAAILKYKSSSGRFEILESLIDYIKVNFDAFHDIKVEQPSINTEHCHIDIYVREPHKYAIIMENKSNWAGDQDHQLSRYIETAISERFAEEQIFVFYLPPLAGIDPEKQSWGRYEESFRDRYVKLSWRDDILPWMRDKVLPNVRYKDVPLSSALEQYIDYWEGQFGLRGVESEERMKMKMAVIEGLALGSEQDAGRALDRISDAIPNAQALTEILENLAKETKCKLEMSFWNELIAALREKGYDDIERINLTENDILNNYRVDKQTMWDYVGIRIWFQANGRPFDFECWAQTTGHYGFRFMDESEIDKKVINRPSELNNKSKIVEQIVKEILPGCEHWQQPWYGCASDSDLNFRGMGYKTVVEKLGTDDKCKAFAQQWAVRFDGYIEKFKNMYLTRKNESQPKESLP
jgi:hypothetical protein